MLGKERLPSSDNKGMIARMNNVMAYRKIAAKIKVLLDFRNISYKNMGNIIGYSKADVGHWIRMKKTPPVEALIKIADFARIHRNYFLKEFDSHGEVFGTAEISEGIDLDEICYMEAMADLIRELEKTKERD